MITWRTPLEALTTRRPAKAHEASGSTRSQGRRRSNSFPFRSAATKTGTKPESVARTHAKRMQTRCSPTTWREVEEVRGQGRIGAIVASITTLGSHEESTSVPKRRQQWSRCKIWYDRPSPHGQVQDSDRDRQLATRESASQCTGPTMFIACDHRNI